MATLPLRSAGVFVSRGLGTRHLLVGPPEGPVVQPCPGGASDQPADRGRLAPKAEVGTEAVKKFAGDLATALTGVGDSISSPILHSPIERGGGRKSLTSSDRVASSTMRIDKTLPES